MLQPTYYSAQIATLNFREKNPAPSKTRSEIPGVAFDVFSNYV